MIPEKIRIEILTPQRKVYDKEVSSVQLPGIEGYFGVFPGHTPYISALRVGDIKIDDEGAATHFATSGGVVEVLPGGISVLAETCEAANEIDKKRAEEARDRARKRIEEGRSNWDVSRADISLARAINRINVVSK